MIVGIDMMLDYTYANFDKTVVEAGATGLDFDLHGRTQFYKGPLPSLA